jgi:hypothetical protein
MKNVAKRAAFVVGLLASGLASAAQDYSGVQTALTAEITAAMVPALVLFGIVAGIAVGFRLIKKATRA